SAHKSNSTVSESVVHATIEADMRAPITGMKHIHAFVPAPIAWRPQHARLRRRHPYSWHPVISFIAVSPIARRPHVTLHWARRVAPPAPRPRRRPALAKPQALKASATPEIEFASRTICA